MINRKRLTRVVGVSVLTGATVLSQSGIASASELGPDEVTEAGVPGGHLDLLESKYGSQTVTKTETQDYSKISGMGRDASSITNIGSIADIKAGGGDITNVGSISKITAEDCADGDVTSIGSIVDVDAACADKINSIGSIVKVTASTKTHEEAAPTPPKAAEPEKPKEVNKPAKDCPADPLLDYNYTVNGVDVGRDLSAIKAGDTIKVDFEVAPGCDDVELSLAIYDAPSDSFTRESAPNQKLADSETKKFDAGKHSMDVVVPDCFYQLDFVRGGVINHFGPVDSTNYYSDQGRLISSANGGEECVAPEVVTPPAPTPETPAPAPVVEVQEVQLAHTGVDTAPLAALGSALLLMGVAMERASKRKRVTGAHFVAA